MLRENTIVYKIGFYCLIVFMVMSCAGGARVSSNKIRAVEAKLDQAYEFWKGTPYQLGGDNKRGIDCSALLMIIMKDQFGVKIPRTTREQLAKGRRISAKSILPGDFIFFKTGANTFHVGVIIRPGKFLHASTSKGVIISEVNNPYWRERVIGYRRFL
jgi:cell wall-associated NlpC family hydrolase